MNLKKLGDVVKISSGGTPSKSKIDYYQNGTIPWVKTGDLKSKWVGKNSEKITNLGLSNSSAKLFPVNTVLVAMYGATIGACSILEIEATTNQACAALLPSPQTYHEYLYYYIRNVKKALIALGQGGGQPNISATILKDVKIPLPPLEDQKRIAFLLSKVENMIAKRKEHLKQLDELLKSVFLEMFGDPVRNEKGWETAQLSNIVIEKIGYGIVQPGDPVDDGIPVIRVGDFVGTRINCGTVQKVKKEISDKHKNSILKGDEILLACVGATIGKVAIVDKACAGFNIVRATARIRVGEDVNKYYIAYFLLSEYSQNYYIKVTRAVGQPTLNIKQIEELYVNLPPIILQNKFGTIVQKIESLKSMYQESLANLENLYGALSQKAFTGELDLSRVKY